MEKVIVIGSGFSSLSAACYLAKAGFQVELFEKKDVDQENKAKSSSKKGDEAKEGKN